MIHITQNWRDHGTDTIKSKGFPFHHSLPTKYRIFSVWMWSKHKEQCCIIYSFTRLQEEYIKLKHQNNPFFRQFIMKITTGNVRIQIYCQCNASRTLIFSNSQMKLISSSFSIHFTLSSTWFLHIMSIIRTCMSLTLKSVYLNKQDGPSFKELTVE